MAEDPGLQMGLQSLGQGRLQKSELENREIGNG